MDPDREGYIDHASDVSPRSLHEGYPSSLSVTPAFTHFVTRLVSERSVNMIRSPAARLDMFANVYIRTERMVRGEVAVEVEPSEELLWEECRGGGWEATLLTGIFALRCRPHDVERRQKCALKLASLLDTPDSGAVVRRFVFYIVAQLLQETAEWQDRHFLLDAAVQGMALFPHEGLYFGVWMRMLALLGKRSSLLGATEARCRTVAAVLEAQKLAHFVSCPITLLSLARLLLEVDEPAVLLTLVAAFIASEKQKDVDGYDSLSAKMRAHLAFYVASAHLALAAASGDAEEHLGEVLNIMEDEEQFPAVPSSFPYAASLMIHIRRITTAADDSLQLVMRRLLESDGSTPHPHAHMDIVTSHAFLLMLSGKTRQAQNYLQQTRTAASQVSAEDFPYSPLPDSGGALESVETVGCQIYYVECFAAYMKAFAVHGRLLEERRALKPRAAAFCPGDPLLSDRCYELLLNDIHAFFSTAILNSWCSLPPPSQNPNFYPPTETEQSNHNVVHSLPPAIQHNDEHFFVSARAAGVVDDTGEILSLTPEEVKAKLGHKAKPPEVIRHAQNDGVRPEDVPSPLKAKVLTRTQQKSYKADGLAYGGPHEQLLDCDAQLASPADYRGKGGRGAEEAAAVPLSRKEFVLLLEAYADYEGEAEVDNADHDLNEDFEVDNTDAGAAEGSIQEVATHHFRCMDKAGRGFVALRTAVNLMCTYLRSNGFDCSKRDVIGMVATYLDPDEPSRIDTHTFASIFVNVHKSS